MTPLRSEISIPHNSHHQQILSIRPASGTVIQTFAPDLQLAIMQKDPYGRHEGIRQYLHVRSRAFSRCRAGGRQGQTRFHVVLDLPPR